MKDAYQSDYGDPSKKHVTAAWNLFQDRVFELLLLCHKKLSRHGELKIKGTFIAKRNFSPF